MPRDDQKETRTEAVEGDFGYVVVYELDPVYETYVAFTAYAVEGRSVPEDQPLFWRKGSHSSMDATPDATDAEPAFDGSVKWDGCSTLDFSDGMHLCGRDAFDKLARAMVTIYERCGELMKERGCNLLEGEFICGPK